ncbi:hypothetical protein [Lacibacter sediminis]|uniref:Uncharacterized protein n=1 Tax=Lacibacter sediminis TaxID=2760713 RepID=A0A7G5XC09_9BACT|nr:hypothetical protein [Lacibacter sediminis]QNA43012.1 hypothetical protein H4075_13030 [Lacibacter sediminis]
MQTGILKNIRTDKGEDQFQIRFLKNEGVGLLTTKNNTNYLILDSLDYWYDLIQNEYPKKKKCTCNNEWFNLQFEYIIRLGTDDYREIKITTTCTNCNKTAKPISIDIDYSPTNHLLSNPLNYCEAPNIKYKFSELTSYWSGDNLKDFLFFMFNDLNLKAYCWFFKYPDNHRFFEKVTFEKALEIITFNHRYLNFYFTKDEINIDDIKKLEDEKGVYIKKDLWRKNEIIELSSPFVISDYGLLYYIHFCNQFLYKGEVKDKSKAFEKDTTKLKNWLKGKFITKRGRNCFDGEEAYTKFITKHNSLR